MSKHCSDELESIDEERYKWQNATTLMIDDFDLDKVKYMWKPAMYPNCLVLPFSEGKGAKMITAVLVIKNKELYSPNLREILKERIKILKKNLEEFKKNLTQ